MMTILIQNKPIKLDDKTLIRLNLMSVKQVREAKENEVMDIYGNENMQYDERGKKITTREGFTGYIDPSIKEYFFQEYKKQDWSVVPGHWPTMETKEDVDEWIENHNKLMEIMEEL